MNEANIIRIIKKITNNMYIGDDCALLDDLGIVVSQDSLVEDIHFKRDWCTPYQLGYKSVIVNISDILASGAEPKYITISLSLPNNINNSFVEQFYLGAKYALKNVKIVGGDITGSTDKIYISIAAIGSIKNKNISSRKNAKKGYAVITTGNYGSSAAGLNELANKGNNELLIKSHLEPKLNYKFSDVISATVKEPYAMMDTSDGLADALFKIAESSNVKIEVNYEKIHHLPDINENNVLYGGEDYNLVAAVPESYTSIVPDAYIIGNVKDYDGIRLDISGRKFYKYEELCLFNHFGGNND